MTVDGGLSDAGRWAGIPVDGIARSWLSLVSHDAEDQDLEAIDCHPPWYFNHTACPYGQPSHLLDATIPNASETSTLKSIALFYSCAPFILTLLVMVYVGVRRRSREICWLFFGAIVSMTCPCFKALFRQPRPRSCLQTCGLPSCHSAFVVGLTLLLVWDAVILREGIPMWFRCLRGFAAVFGVLPHPVGTVILGDASVTQALAGSAFGAVLVVIWLTCLAEPVKWFLIHHICLGRRPSYSSEEDAIELAELTSSALEHQRSQYTCRLCSDTGKDVLAGPGGGFCTCALGRARELDALSCKECGNVGRLAPSGEPCGACARGTAVEQVGLGLGGGPAWYLARCKGGMPHIAHIKDTSEPAFDGTVQSYLKKYPGDERLVAMCTNRIKECPLCRKNCACALESCNQCGHELAKVPMSRSDNHVMGIILGVSRTTTPLIVSLRAQTPTELCYDDILAMSPLHMNCVPTNVYVPDLRFLFIDPPKGLLLLERLYKCAATAALEQFWADSEFRRKFFGNEEPPTSPDGLIDTVLAGVNFPPAVYQLNLQFIHPPLTPFHYFTALERKHFHYRRWFPLEWLRKALSLGDVVRVDVHEDTAIEDIISRAASQGVDYDIEHSAHIKKFQALQARYAAWKEEDFECHVAGGQVFDVETSSIDIGAEKDRIQRLDKMLMQSYGYPLDEKKRVTGSYYAYPKEPHDIADFASWNPPAA